MKCAKPRRIFKNLEKTFPMGLLVECGQCIQCRINRRELWTTRLLHESLEWDSSIFVTLTYNDENIPLTEGELNDFDPHNQTLKKSDLQKFFKRLRHNLGNRKIKYFATGDYGEKTFRPHYHLIIFGMSNKREDLDIIKSSWPLCNWANLGQSPFGTVTKQSIQYCVAYIEKIITGKWGPYEYNQKETPFHIMSKGMGKNYALKNNEIIKEDNFVQIKGTKKPIPRYYKKILNIQNDSSKDYQEIKEREFVKNICGIDATRDELYLTAPNDLILQVEGVVAQNQVQRELNIKSLLQQKSRKI
ncbi:MAG: replication initiator protein [Arizlama microvirus]|nr:MAG: replication initiator protein [Arizlama microvirus]